MDTAEYGGGSESAYQLALRGVREKAWEFGCPYVRCFHYVSILSRNPEQPVYLHEQAIEERITEG